MQHDNDGGQEREKDPAAVSLGRRGGKKGGAARAAKLTPEERTASASAAAAARWAKEKASLVGASDDEIELKGGRPPKPFRFTLTPDEVLIILGAKGQGGQQTLHRRLVQQLADGNLTIELDDRRLGELIRYMTRYGSGGFQDRLKRAFKQQFDELFAFLRDP